MSHLPQAKCLQTKSDRTKENCSGDEAIKDCLGNGSYRLAEAIRCFFISVIEGRIVINSTGG